VNIKSSIDVLHGPITFETYIEHSDSMGNADAVYKLWFQLKLYLYYIFLYKNKSVASSILNKIIPLVVETRLLLPTRGLGPS